MDDVKPLYPAYAGLGRVAMFWGVPLMPALGVFVGSVVSALTGAAIFGPGGLLLVVLGIPALVFFRHVCETDDQALRILWFEAQSCLARTNAGLFGGTFTLAPMQYGRSLHVYAHAFERPPSVAMCDRLRVRMQRARTTEREEGFPC